MPVDLYYHAAAASGDRLFVSGGLSVKEVTPGGASLRLVRDVFVSRIDTGGRLGKWTRAGALMESVFHHAMAVWQGRLYVAGGQDEKHRLVQTVWSAAINQNGTLGGWRAEAPLPKPRFRHRLLVSKERLIIAGGIAEGDIEVGTPLLWTAAPDAAGAITSWTETRAPVAAFYDGSAGIAGERLYLLGIDGVLHSASLPAFADWRAENTWRLYRPVLGSSNPTDANMGPVHLSALGDILVATIVGGNALTAPLDAAGRVGTWRSASRFYGVRSGFAIASTPRALFALGGVTGRGPVERHAEVWSTRRE